MFRRKSKRSIPVFAFFIICFFLLIVEKKSGNFLNPFREVLVLIIYPAQRLALMPSNIFRKINSWIEMVHVFNQDQEILQKQHLEMEKSSIYAFQLEMENRVLKDLLRMTETQYQQEFIVLEVMYEIENNPGCHIVFGRGRKSGVMPGMALVDKTGLAGQITRVTSITSEAVFLGNKNISVPIQVSRNGLRAICFGSGYHGKLELRHLPVNSDIEKGDILVTSGLGGSFPFGLPVAKVLDIQEDQDSGFLSISLEVLSHLDNNRYFLAIRKQEFEMK